MSNFQIETIVVSEFEQNCRLLINNKGCILVDPGADAEKIIDKITSLNLTPVAVLITHGHLDHVGAAKAIVDHYKIRSFGPNILDRDMMNNCNQIGLNYGLDNYQDFESDHYFQDGDSLNLIGLNFTVEHTPGHSPGHVIYRNDDHKFVLCGDLVFSESIGRTDLPLSEPEKIGFSIKKSILSLDDDYKLYTGHRHDTSVGRERANNPYLIEFDKLKV